MAAFVGHGAGGNQAGAATGAADGAADTARLTVGDGPGTCGDLPWRGSRRRRGGDVDSPWMRPSPRDFGAAAGTNETKGAAVSGGVARHGPSPRVGAINGEAVGASLGCSVGGGKHATNLGAAARARHHAFVLARRHRTLPPAEGGFAATSRLPSVDAGRGDAAAAKWIFRGGGSRRFRGFDVDIPAEGGVAATPRLPR